MIFEENLDAEKGQLLRKICAKSIAEGTANAETRGRSKGGESRKSKVSGQVGVEE